MTQKSQSGMSLPAFIFARSPGGRVDIEASVMAEPQVTEPTGHIRDKVIELGVGDVLRMQDSSSAV